MSKRFDPQIQRFMSNEAHSKDRPIKGPPPRWRERDQVRSRLEAINYDLKKDLQVEKELRAAVEAEADSLDQGWDALYQAADDRAFRAGLIILELCDLVPRKCLERAAERAAARWSELFSG
jgi:hypothetical protein